jgi:protein TonB
MSSRRMLSCSIASLTVHGGAAAALFLGLSSSVKAPPQAAMVVELAALPSAPPVTPSDTPPAPKQDEAQPKPVVDKLKIPPLPKLALDIKPEVSVPLKPLEDEKKPVADKPADETTRPATPEAPVKDAPKAPAIGAPSNIPSTAEQSWEARVLAVLERKKRYPADAQRQGEEDVVYVRIAVDRSGHVVDSQIRKSRGYAMLDSEVMALVQRASPLPAPPREVTGNPVTLLIPVDFFLAHHGS